MSNNNGQQIGGAHPAEENHGTGCCPTPPATELTQTFATKRRVYRILGHAKCHRRRRKSDEPERAPLLGRATNNVGIGIVGLPNVGKSTFSILYPTCTYLRKIIRSARRSLILQKSLYQISDLSNFAKLLSQKVKLRLY